MIERTEQALTKTMAGKLSTWFYLDLCMVFGLVSEPIVIIDGATMVVDFNSDLV
jgi:hypothetical protein